MRAAALILGLHKERQSRVSPFPDWLPAVSPSFNWSYPHLRYLQEHLNKVTRGELLRLMIFMPPRHFKSETVTVRYSAWRLECDPTMRVIVGAYNKTLAEKFSRKARKIVRDRIPLNKERTAAEDWETDQGGGLRAAGVGGGVTGQGGDLIIIDDPVKSREEANSQTYRDKVWEWYTDDLYTRLEPHAALILIMTRWHEDDLAGRILASEDGPNWTVISLPAEAEDNDPLGRQYGEALCPERFDETALARIKMVLGLSYYALYQQRPQPPEGGMFKRDAIQIVDTVPTEGQRIRFWDKAATADGGDYTVGIRMLRSREGFFYIEDVVRGQWDTAKREARIRETAEMDGKPTTIWLEQEPGSGGKDSAASSIRNLAGYAAFAERSTGDKVTRAEPFAAQWGAGNVRLVRAAWNPAYLSELAAFPSAMHDDQVDASSGAFNKLAITAGELPANQPEQVSKFAHLGDFDDDDDDNSSRWRKF